MRQFFLFLVFFLGLFWVIDAVATDGQNSAGAWEEVVRAGKKMSSTVQIPNGQYWGEPPMQPRPRMSRTSDGRQRTRGSLLVDMMIDDRRSCNLATYRDDLSISAWVKRTSGSLPEGTGCNLPHWTWRTDFSAGHDSVAGTLDLTELS